MQVVYNKKAMNKIFLMITLLVASTLTQAQSKDSAHPQHKNEKTEIKQADQHRLQMEKEQLQAKPEIIHSEKMSGKQTNKKLCCKARKGKKI